MSVNIVTGFTGRAHITSDDDRIRNAAYIGTDKFVMPFGHQFEAEVQNNNLIRIKDGMLMNQGTQMGIELTDYEDVVIENGLSGTNRNDLIVMRYEKQDDTGLESASLVVIKGTSGATASDPAYISGNILDGGDLIDDYPLYRVKIESLSIVAVQQLFSTRADVGSELNRIENAFNNKMNKTNPTGTESLSLNRKANTNVGGNSVAVNSYNTASGTASFASGENTTARGNASFASGENTIAGGLDSHAEGYNTIASGYASHAEGIGTTAGYQNQTVVGIYNDNNSSNLFEIGNGTSSSNRSNALEVRQNGDVHAGGDFYDGEGNKVVVDISGKMDKTNPTGTGSFSMNRKADTSVGNYSVAEGYDATASGENSHAEGRCPTSSGISSHAEGDSTTAGGSCSHSEGESTTASGRASHAEGYNTAASGAFSHAGGFFTTSQYQNQTVIGKHNDNKETNLFEVGNGTSSSNRSNALEVRQNGDVHAGGDFYDGEGNKVVVDISGKMDKTNPTGTGSFSMNRKANTTVGVLSATVNENNTASGDGSFASGHNNTASGLYSNASGTSTTASGSYSHAEGNNTTASGGRSHAEGDSTTAGGSCSHSEGESTTASGRASHAEGMNTTASGTRSHAAGYWTTAGYSNQTVVGKHNDNKETNLFEVGNGISGNSKSNAFEVAENGNAIAGADLLYDGHKRITGSYANDILVECTDLELGPDNTITGRDKDNVPIHSGTYDLKVGSIIYVPEDLHFGMNVPAGLYEVLYLVDGGNDISYLSFGDYQRDEPDPTHVKYMPKSLEERIETALLTTKIASGNPISVSDSAHVNAEELKVELEPKQDLHGYDKPWVGGAGKNKLPLVLADIKSTNTSGAWSGNVYTLNGVDFTILTDSDNNVAGINVNGTNNSGDWIALYLPASLEGGTYIVSGSPSGAGDYYLQAVSVSDGVDAHVLGGNEAEITLSPNLSDFHARIVVMRGVAVSNATFQPMIRLATETDPTFEPYSNICPISGYDETSVVRTGKNMTVGIEQGTIHSDTNKVAIDIRCRAKEFVPVKKNSTLTLNVNTNKSKELQICWYLCESNTFGGGNTIISGSDWMSNPAAITIPGNCYLLYIIRYSDDSTISSSDLSNIQLELGSTATSYEPYTADTYTLQFGDTVYGAEVNFVSGVATVTKGYIAEYAGETLPSTWISDRDVYASGTTPTTGAQVVYKLATPYTIQLTPQQIKMLKGNNVLVADGEMELGYQVDSVVGDVKEWAEEKFIPYNTYRTPPVYGFHIDWSNSDPSSRVTYIADNANFMSAYMDYTSDKFRYNSWRDIWFIKYCKPCILNQDGTVKAYLNPNDSTKDIDGNTVTIDENLTGANVEIEFPEIWYKVVPDAGNVTSASVYFSPVKVDEDYKDYAYIDKNGVHKEHFYMPAYNGSVLSGTTVMRSISGQAVSKNLDASTEITYAKANGDGWNTEDAGEIMLINLLLILLGKSTDTQTVFGRGIDSGDETAFNNYVTGTGNLKGLFYGTNTGTGLVKVFGIENWWGLQWRRYAGDVLDNGVRKVKLCYGNEDGSTTFDFNIDGTGYVDVGVTPSGTNGGYIRTMKFAHDGMYSAISDGSSSTYYCDGQWFNNTYHTIYALRGGGSDCGVHCGAFCVSLSSAPGIRGWYVGAAVSYK